MNERERRQLAVVAEHSVQVDGSGTVDSVASQPSPALAAPESSPPLFVGIALALYGLLGAPPTAAIYLAWRMRRRSSSGSVLLPAVVAVLGLCVLGVLFRAPMARWGSFRLTS